jgi:Tat protein translocase TatB subunit
MNFFNIGTAELLLIFVIALIVVGPRRLPEIAQGLGKIMRDLRKMSHEFTVDMMREMNAPPPDVAGNEAKEIPDQSVSEKPIESLGEIVSDVRKTVQEFTEEVTRELDISLEPKENEAKKVADQNVPEKPAQGDQA